VDAAVLIPVKRFTAAKRRLAGILDVDERAELARWLAGRVVTAAHPSPVFVACDDDGVAAWADEAGADVLWSPGLGLNGAVDAGRATIAGKGFDHLVIVHSDIPLAHDLPGLAATGTITVVPDRRRAGTNVLALPVSARVPASYGVGSFIRHLEMAMQSGFRVEVRSDPRLALDVDNPDDLAHPLLADLLPQWLRTILVSRR
jgi:2-phospho-L-lactate/phosphoenolpyruvate guanylyltransferase